jgi:ABC-type sulfate transport system substrate-binding protein
VDVTRFPGKRAVDRFSSYILFGNPKTSGSGKKTYLKQYLKVTNILTEGKEITRSIRKLIKYRISEHESIFRI